MIKYYFEQRSDAWFDARCGRVTGIGFKDLMTYENDIKKAKNSIGYNNLVTRIAVETITGEVEPTYQNDIMQRGLDLEPFARIEYEHLFDVVVDEVGFVIPDEDSPFHDWVGVSPDGLTDGLLEIKCPLGNTHFKYLREASLPPEYRWQVQGQLFVTGLLYCDFMSYYPKMKPFIIRIEPDEIEHERITERLNIFIEDVKLELEKYKSYDYR